MNWQKYVQIASLIAIPFVIGVGGFVSDHYLQGATLKRDYIQLAVQILQNPNKQNPGLRKWAIKLIDNYAEIKLESDLVEKLKKGEVLWPSEIAKPLLSSLRNILLVFEKHQRASFLGITLPRGDFDDAMLPFLLEILPYTDREGCKTAISILKNMANVSGKKELLLQYEKKIENG